MKNLFQKYGWLNKLVAIVIMLTVPAVTFAAGAPKPSELSNPLAQIMLIIIVALLIVIAVLANVVMGAADLYLQRFRDEKKRNASLAGKAALVILFCFISATLFAQAAPAASDAAAAAADNSFSGLSATSFYCLLSVLLLEVIIILALLYNLKLLLKKEALIMKDAGADDVIVVEGTWTKWWDKFNSFRPIQEEAEIDLGHEYDGIRELDNRLPPWWLYGFYLCIIFAGIYLYRYHVAHSAPLSHDELKIALAKADEEKQEYLKKSANNVDETTVKLLTDANDLEVGKKVFTTICATCHKADGGGNVGPNLTDDYWLHGGSIQDVFKTIKYGWPDKGMQPWKDQYSPMQIAQIASYVKSLHGTNPPNAKDPQGTLYEEKKAAATTDTTKTAEPKKL